MKPSANKHKLSVSKLPLSHPLKIYLITLGCSKNVYDSEILMGQLEVNGALLVPQSEQAEVIIINTCGFILPAKEESIQTILEAVEYKKRKENLKVIVCGCLSARYYHQLKKYIPEVDAYFGTEEFSDLLNYLNFSPRGNNHLYPYRVLSEKPHYAYLKISEGCNHKCAFCAIPLMRGKLHSRPLEDIVQEAELLTHRGVKEIILVAQDSTSYGADLYQKPRLIPLLEKLEKIKDLHWIRLHYTYPTTFQDELVEVIAKSDKIVHYIDLPIQHISDKVLKLMKRGSSNKKIKKILYDIRQKIPDAAIRTTLIVGHPGEAKADFQELLKFITDFQFERLGTFIYSPEENTSAYHLPAPRRSVAQERYREIMQAQQYISWQKNQLLINHQRQVLIDEYDPNTQIARGRTYADSPEIDNEVLIQKKLIIPKPGEFYNVKITDATEYELYGEILEE